MAEGEKQTFPINMGDAKSLKIGKNKTSQLRRLRQNSFFSRMDGQTAAVNSRKSPNKMVVWEKQHCWEAHRHPYRPEPTSGLPLSSTFAIFLKSLYFRQLQAKAHLSRYFP